MAARHALSWYSANMLLNVKGLFIYFASQQICTPESGVSFSCTWSLSGGRQIEKRGF